MAAPSLNAGTPFVVADIGGTNARFALVDPGSTEVYNVEVLQVADFACIADAFRHFTKRHAKVPPSQACLALAGPVDGDQVRLTNGAWGFSINQTAQELSLDRLVLVNDFKAQAAALPYLNDEQLRLLGGGAPVKERPRLIIGPGTGLGVGAAVPTGDGYVIVESEGGHIGLSPASERELAVHHILQKQFGRVSAERVLCGAGLRNLCAALHLIEAVDWDDKTEAEIVSDALAGKSDLCSETLDMFLAYLGGVAGDLALSFGSLGGVYITGGIVPRILERLEISEFRARFEAKGRVASMVRDIPTYLVTSEQAGLTGAAACLKEAEV